MSVATFIGIGSNQNDPLAQVQQAFTALDGLTASQVVATSRCYRNPPMGPVAQPDYVNAVAQLDTALKPQSLLDALKALEVDAGRQLDGVRWGARPLDLDILLYAEQTLDTQTLQIPHPGLPSRAFVLYPLADIDPTLVIPGMGPLEQLMQGISAADLVAIE